jgi:hypothetical protein
MTSVRRVAVIAIAVVLAACNALAQATTSRLVSGAENTRPAPAKDADERTWSFSVSAYTYIVPDDRTYVQPTITADRGWLHLEARYNYEDVDTGSAWIGYNFSFGEKLTLDLAPMIGGVFGSTTGVAPGYKGSLAWWKLELYSETEYVFDTSNSSDSFLYTWSELTLAPVDSFRFGLVVQRTRLYQTDFDIQRGLLIAFSYKRADFTACIFNPDAGRPTFVLAVGLGF